MEALPLILLVLGDILAPVLIVATVSHRHIPITFDALADKTVYLKDAVMVTLGISMRVVRTPISFVASNFPRFTHLRKRWGERVRKPSNLHADRQ